MKQYAIYDLEPGMVLAQDIFLSDSAITAFLRKGYVLTEQAIERLNNKRVAQVWVEDPWKPAEPKKMAAHSPAGPLLSAAKSAIPPLQHSVPPRLKAEAIQTLQSTFTDILISDEGVLGSRESLDAMDSVVAQLVQTIAGNRSALLNIQDLKHYDDDTYHHSLSVAVLAIGLGRHLGMPTPQLHALGMGAIMHDIGKIAVPLEILRKPSRLNAQEFGIVKNHAKAGTSYLISSALGSEELWRAVLFHHEKLDGSGYPNGLAGGEIPLWSRIISVSDVFDALTSVKPFRTAVAPADALEYIMGGIDSAFDYDVVSALMHRVALYPVGSCVRLSDDSIALVLDNENPNRPVVEILGKGDIVDLQHDRQYLNVVISGIVPREALMG